MTAFAVIVLPIIAAISAVGAAHRWERAAPAFGIGGTAAAWAAAVAVGVQQWGGADPSVVGDGYVDTGGFPISFVLRVDQLSASMLVLATSVALLVQVYSVGYLRGDPRYPSYVAFVCLFTSAMALVVTADDLFVLLVGWEVMGACSYLLIGHHWELEPARAGAVKAFVMTRVGDLGLLVGIFVLGKAAETYRVSGVIEAALAGEIGTGTATTACLLVLCGVVGKSAQFPLHTWLPDAMPGPTPISALIHAATMVAAGVFLVARLLPVFVLSDVALGVLSAVAVVTMLGASLFALAADDLKRVLAWSTVSQLALMFGALSLGTVDGYAAGVLHLLSHGVFKALLFLAAGSVVHAVGTQRLSSMGGLRRAMPWTFATMTVGFAALAGVPPLVGFFSKDAVLAAAVDAAFHGEAGRGWPVLVAALLTTVLTTAYCVRAWLMVFLGARAGQVTGPDAVVVAPVHESPPEMVGPLGVLAALGVLGGVAVLRPTYLGLEPEHLHVGVALTSIVLVGLSAFVVVAEWSRSQRCEPAEVLGPFRTVLAREASYDTLLDHAVVRPTWRLSRLTAVVESDVVEPYPRGADTGAGWASRLLRWFHDGDVQRYVTVIVLGAVSVAVVVGMVRP